MAAIPTTTNCANSPLNTTVRKHKNGTFSKKTQSGVTYNTCTSVELDYAVFALNVKNGINWDWCKTESGWGYCDPWTECPEEY